jgi:nucleolar GTP-binding protein
LLENDDWKYDQVPELLNGKNIADFVDPDILQKLEALEREEELLLGEMNQEGMENELKNIPYEYVNAMEEIKHKTEDARMESVLRKKLRSKSKNRSLEGLQEKLRKKGVSAEKVTERF